MTKWKKNAKKVLVFFLVFGFIGGMMDHLRVTASAAGTEGEQFPGTAAGVREDETDKSECVCVLACTEEAKSADCSLCREDVSACKGRSPEDQTGKQPDENGGMESEDTKPEDTDSKNPESEDTESENLDSADKDKNESAGILADLEAARVEEMIKELPSLEELKAFDQEALKAAYEQIQNAFDAFESLDDSQKAMLPGAEEQLKELLEYFTTLIMPLSATDEDIERARDAMTEAMVNWESEIDLSGYNLTEEDMKKICPEVIEDNPDLFYVMDYIYFTEPGTGIVQNCKFTYSSEYDRSSVAEYMAAIDKAFSEVIENNMTDEQKATALHDYLVQQIGRAHV